MWPYHPDLLATPVPRYTSFPTAAEFAEDVDAKDFKAALGGHTGDVSLYVHIPFCEKICWYCGCNTSVANRSERMASYLDALHREIALVAERLPNAANVTRIAFGGGSPNAIAPVDLVRLIDAITIHFGTARPSMSIELDPRSMTQEWAAVIGGTGFARASLGVQTFAPRLQEAIGRIQPLESIRQTTEWLRGAGTTSLNFDLIYGLPGQTLEDLEEGFEHAVALGADRIALFGYAHVPHMIARQKKIDATALPDAEKRFAMAAFGYQWLTSHGYEPVGFDHFALPGDPMAQAARSGRLRRNFQGFTDDEAPVLLGLGASAISSFPELLVQNEKNTGRYRMMLSQDRVAASRGVRRSAQDQERGALIEQLLCNFGAEIDPVLLRDALPGLEPFIEKGLLSVDAGRCEIAPAGIPYARSIAAQFDPYRKATKARFSSAV